MRRFVLCTAALLLISAGSVGYAQATKVSNPDDYRKAMVAIAAGMAEVNKAITSNTFADAKKSLAPVRATMAAVQQFWVDNKKDDPAILAKDAVIRLDALDGALGAAAPAQVPPALKSAQASCGACHGKYREQDPTTKVFNIKAGTL